MDDPAKLGVVRFPRTQKYPAFYDLQRLPNGYAVISDPRNDASPFTAHLHLAFSLNHNKIVREIGEGCADRYGVFEKAADILIGRWHSIIENDFLKTLCDQDMLRIVRKKKIYRLISNDPDGVYIPLEFAGAAMRLHPLVRSSYVANPISNAMPLTSILRERGPNKRLFKRGHFGSVIPDWRRFFSFPKTSPYYVASINARTKAAPLSPQLTPVFSAIAPTGTSGDQTESLAALTLLSGNGRMASGQDYVQLANAVDEALAIKPLDPGCMDQMLENIVSKKTRCELRGRTPLWYYLMAEAHVAAGGQRLGQLGSFFLATTILGILKCRRTIRRPNSKGDQCRSITGFFESAPDSLYFR